MKKHELYLSCDSELEHCYVLMQKGWRALDPGAKSEDLIEAIRSMNRARCLLHDLQKHPEPKPVSFENLACINALSMNALNLFADRRDDLAICALRDIRNRVNEMIGAV